MHLRKALVSVAGVPWPGSFDDLRRHIDPLWIQEALEATGTAKAARWHEAIARWISAQGDGAMNLAALHAWLVEEHGYSGSRPSVQRYVGAAFPCPARRARRRVETPPGAQAQVDWPEFREVSFGDGPRDLYALHVQLSHSRFDVVVWSQDQLAWLTCHSGALRRLGGVPATMRIDNEKTAIARGAGAWGEIHIAPTAAMQRRRASTSMRARRERHTPRASPMPSLRSAARCPRRCGSRPR